jgi:hypothetical protein
LGAGASKREVGMAEIKNGVDFLYICVPMLETEERKEMFHEDGGEGEKEKTRHLWKKQLKIIV